MVLSHWFLSLSVSCRRKLHRDMGVEEKDFEAAWQFVEGLLSKVKTAEDKEEEHKEARIRQQWRSLPLSFFGPENSDPPTPAKKAKHQEATVQTTGPHQELGMRILGFSVAFKFGLLSCRVSACSKFHGNSFFCCKMLRVLFGGSFFPIYKG